MNLKEAKKIYMIGIKGAGMTALAQVLKSRGKEVSGSDTHEKFFTDEILKSENIKFYEGFDAKHLETEKPDLVIYSTAYDYDNPELKTAKGQGIETLSYPEILGLLLRENFGIAVCGTHGKTTTTAMLGFVLAELEADPTVLVGGAVPQFSGNARIGKGEYMIIEADEYQNKFLHFNPRGILLTNIEYDHPDFFKNEEEYINAFSNFVTKVGDDGFVVACFDELNIREATKNAKCKIISYGLRQGEWQARNLSQITGSGCSQLPSGCSQLLGGGSEHLLRPAGMEFEVLHRGESQGNFSIQLLGSYNVANALAVIALASHLGYDIQEIREVLSKFGGTVRRFEIKAEINGVTIIDDYAHHPREIKETLKAARARYPNGRIWCIFHPHTFTRTRTFLSDFAKSFHDADKIIVLDIYGSAREKQGGVHSRDLVELIKKEKGDASYISTIDEVVEFLVHEVRSGDVVITMGAGDVWRVGEKLIQKIR